MRPTRVAAFGGLPPGPQLLSIGSLRRCTFLPSTLTSSEPGPTKRAGPSTFDETTPPPVPLLAMSPTEVKVAPRIATLWRSNSTRFEKPLGELPDFAMFGSGVGMNGAGGPGILQTL